jgi:hypothetical protein
MEPLIGMLEQAAHRDPPVKPHKVLEQILGGDAVLRGTIAGIAGRIKGTADAAGKVATVITLFNVTRREYSKELHALYRADAQRARLPLLSARVEGSWVDIWPGLRLRCTKTSAELSARAMYEVVRWDTVVVVLRAKDGSRVKVQAGALDSYLSLPYGITCQCSQGSDIDGPFVIADSRSQYAAADWCYTAVTRAQYLAHVHLAYASCDKARDEAATRYLATLAAGARRQDEGRSPGLTLDQKRPYISAAGLRGILRVQPRCCRCKLYLTIDENDDSCLSGQRVDNDELHYIDNLVLECRGCNKAQSDKHDAEAQEVLDIREACLRRRL